MPDLPPDGAPHEPWLAGRPEGEGCAMREFEGQRVPTHVDVDSPPPGATFYGTNSDWVLTASTRSWQALTWIPFAAFWNGAVWFGLYGQQIATGNYSLLLSLVGLPFVLAGLVLLGTTAESFCYKLSAACLPRVAQQRGTVVGQPLRYCETRGIRRRREGLVGRWTIHGSKLMFWRSPPCSCSVA
jgi:hypothetical protein